MSLCDRQAIPESLIHDRNDEQSFADGEFEDDIETLLGFSFISVSASKSTFEMHRLVQLATRKWLEARGVLEEHVLKLVNRLDQAFPSGNHTNWSECQVLFPHARSALNFVPGDQTTALQWASVMERTAQYASGREGILLWTSAIEIGTKCWETEKKVLGEEHRNTLVSMSNLAVHYYNLGETGKAVEKEEPMLGDE